MRQAGVLAAAGLMRSEYTPQRLPRITPTRGSWRKGPGAHSGIQIDARKVATNIRWFRRRRHGLASAEISARLKRGAC